MSKPTADVSTVLIRHAADLRALLRYQIEVVELQQHEPDLRNHETASELLESVVSTLCRQVERLDQYLETRGTAQTPVQAATRAMAGAFLGFITKLRSHETAKILRDDCTLLNLAALDFLTLHTTATTLNETALASVAAKSRLELLPLIDAFVRLMPRVIEEELQRTLGSRGRAPARTAVGSVPTLTSAPIAAPLATSG